MHFEVRRDDLRTHRIVDEPSPALHDGQVLLHLDQAALTANNVTYAALGEAMGYWRFFPADDGWGRVPVWGFADVETSTLDDVPDGERIYGYFPMASHLVVTPGHTTRSTFVDTAEHRAGLPQVYNQYTRFTDRLSEHDERVHAVLRPLFTTSFLIDDWLAGEAFFGASSVVIASASSKTALALAASLAANRDVGVVGLTSARNAGFVEGVGYYDRVASYDDIASLDPTTPTVLVDMGGDAGVLSAVHGHFGEELRHSCRVGATHWEQMSFGAELPGPRPVMFFAPDQLQRRLAEWGPAGFGERVGTAWDAFTVSAAEWLELDVRRGPQAIAEAFDDVLEGRVPPDHAVIITPDP